MLLSWFVWFLLFGLGLCFLFFFSFLDFFILSLVRNISDCYPFFDLEHGSWEEAEQMAVLKLTTIWFLLLWQTLLPRKVLDENSWVSVLQMAFVEMKMKFWESRSSSRSLLPPGALEVMHRLRGFSLLVLAWWFSDGLGMV